MPGRSFPQKRGRNAAQVTSISDEIALFLERNIDKLSGLPPVINIALSGERKPEAWHIRVPNRQVIRGFNKSAPVTIMLPLESWQKLMKKNDQVLWQEALEKGQIHIHGEEEAVAAVAKIFHANGKQDGELVEELKEDE